MTTKRVLLTHLAAVALLGPVALLAGVACSPGQTPAVPATPAAPAAPAASVGSRAGSSGPSGSPGTPGAVLVCRANFEFAVEVDGAYPRDARLYQSDSRGRFLVDIPSQTRGFLVDLATRRVTTVPPATLVREAETGLIRFVDPGPAAEPVYALAIEGPVLRFRTERSTVRVLAVLEREPIIGPVAFDALIADRAEYREGMKAYRPNLDAIATISKSKTPIEIEAYFGTWCAHCKMFMPKFLRVIQDAANPSIKLTLVGVPKGFGNIDGPWKGKNITGIPAIIMTRQGSEMARLDSHDHAVPESELAAILGAIK